MARTILCIQSMFVLLVVIEFAGAQNVGSQHSVSQGLVTIERCNVQPAKVLDVSSSEAGQLVILKAKEGSRVKENEPIGKVDDEEAQMQREAAKHGMGAAKFQAEDKINVEYSVKVQEVAEQELKINRELNEKRPGAVPFVEMEKLRLESDRAGLGLKKAINDRRLAKFEYYIKETEHRAADKGIKRRIVRAPVNGEVVELYRQQGEWVNPGDPILQLVQLDTLHVEGKLPAEKYEPSDVLGCEVTVKQSSASRTVEGKGRVVWVHPEMIYEGEELWVIRVELPNELVNGNWKMHPGRWATIEIHLGTAKDVRISQRGD